MRKPANPNMKDTAKRNRSRNQEFPWNKQKPWQALTLNARRYNHYYTLLMELAINRFKWIGLPSTVDERFLELALFRNGCAVIFKPYLFNNFITTMVNPEGVWNFNENPTKLFSYGNNGWMYRMSADKGVIVWGNRTRTPLHNMIDLYARDLADFDQTRSVNLRAQKTPVFITCPEARKQDMINLYKNYDGNEPLIIGSDTLMDASSFGSIQTNAPYLVNLINADKQTIFQEAMTLLGIDNSNVQKRERVQAAEVMSNNGQIEIFRLAALNARRQACEELNEKYGLECSVVWNHDLLSANYNFANSVPAMTGEGAVYL